MPHRANWRPLAVRTVRIRSFVATLVVVVVSVIRAALFGSVVVLPLHPQNVLDLETLQADSLLLGGTRAPTFRRRSASKPLPSGSVRPTLHPRMGPAPQRAPGPRTCSCDVGKFQHTWHFAGRLKETQWCLFCSLQTSSRSTPDSVDALDTKYNTVMKVIFE